MLVPVCTEDDAIDQSRHVLVQMVFIASISPLHMRSNNRLLQCSESPFMAARSLQEISVSDSSDG